MAKKRVRELPLDDIVRAIVRAAKRIDAEGGYVRCHMEFGAKPDQPDKQPPGKDAPR